MPPQRRFNGRARPPKHHTQSSSPSHSHSPTDWAKYRAVKFKAGCCTLAVRALHEIETALCSPVISCAPLVSASVDRTLPRSPFSICCPIHSAVARKSWLVIMADNIFTMPTMTWHDFFFFFALALSLSLFSISLVLSSCSLWCWCSLSRDKTIFYASKMTQFYCASAK